MSLIPKNNNLIFCTAQNVVLTRLSMTQHPLWVSVILLNAAITERFLLSYMLGRYYYSKSKDTRERLWNMWQITETSRKFNTSVDFCFRSQGFRQGQIVQTGLDTKGSRRTATPPDLRYNGAVQLYHWIKKQGVKQEYILSPQPFNI